MPNHPDLTDLVRILRRNASTEKVTSRQLSRQIVEICRRLWKKFPEPQPVLRRTIESLSSIAVNPHRENIKSLLDTPEFKIALCRMVDATLYTHQKSRDIYCGLLDDYLDVVRLVGCNRLILQNAFVLLSDESIRPCIQSWARPKSKSAEYKKHLRSSRHPEKSKFSLPIDVIEAIELVLFNRGCGLMSGASRIFFYGKFSGEIGELASRGGKTCYVRLQCDRGSRPTGRGTRVEIHAYPVSFGEIISDFANCTSSADMLKSIERQVFELPKF